MNVKVVGAGILSLLLLVGSVVFYHNVVGYNAFENYQVKQSIGGSVSIVDTPGYYWKGFATITDYPRAMEAAYSKATNGQIGDSIKAVFNDGGTADVSSYVRIALPTNADQRLLLHQQFSANKRNITDAVKAHLANCIKATGPVMSASENQASRKSEFNQLIEEQLAVGLYKMRRTEIELNDLATVEESLDSEGNKITHEKAARVQATEVVNDTKTGKAVVVQTSPLAAYGIGILQFSITEIDYDDQTLLQFSAKKKSYLAAEQAKAERQQEVQQRLMVQEKGRRQVADVQAEENQKKERALIQANQSAEVAVINKAQAVTAGEQRVAVAKQLQQESETLKQIASIKAQTAELDAKASIARAEGRAKELELGGGLSEKDKILAEIAANRDIGVAKSLAELRVPNVVITGGEDGKGGGGLTASLINMTLLRSLGILKDHETK